MYSSTQNNLHTKSTKFDTHTYLINQTIWFLYLFDLFFIADAKHFCGLTHWSNIYSKSFFLWCVHPHAGKYAPLQSPQCCITLRSIIPAMSFRSPSYLYYKQNSKWRATTNHANRGTKGWTQSFEKVSGKKLRFFEGWTRNSNLIFLVTGLQRFVIRLSVPWAQTTWIISKLRRKKFPSF